MIGYFSNPTFIRRAIDREERGKVVKKIREERDDGPRYNRLKGVVDGYKKTYSISKICTSA